MSMDQTQRPSGQGDTTVPHDPYENYELPVEGFKGTPEEIERQWYEKCYLGRGDTMKQLTWRAVIMGSVLGAVLSLTNLYIGLKAGWGFGVAITACILSYAIWTGFYKMRLAKTQMTILENNCMQSTASAAGYSTGGTLVSAFAAYIMLNNQTLPLSLMLAWVFFIAVLGVTMAMPMKRQMINVEQLRFPSGIAAAETLRALHATGQKGMRAARALSVAGLLAMISAVLTDGLRLISARLEAFQVSTLVGRFSSFTIGEAWIGRTVTFIWDPIFIAAGVFVGMRVAISMIIGSIACWMIFVPWIQTHVPEAAGLTGFRDLVQWTLWAGTACMVTSGILSVFFEWRSALSAFKGLGDMVFKRTSDKRDELAAIETPGSWFLIGQVVALIALAWLAHATFGMPYWQSVIAVLLSFALALVACRVTGETDTTPVGAMGKITQLTFGALSPGNMNVNLMAANITAGAATSSADLLTDLKSGYLLGAHPRKQFIAQFSGHLHRHPRHRGGVPHPCSRCQRAGHGSISGSRRADLERRRRGYGERAKQHAPGESLESGNRRTGRPHPADSLSPVPQISEMDSLGGRCWSGLGFPMVLRYAVLPRRFNRLRLAEEKSEPVRGISVPGSLRNRRGRRAYGRRARVLGERRRDTEGIFRIILQSMIFSRAGFATCPFFVPTRRFSGGPPCGWSSAARNTA